MKQLLLVISRSWWPCAFSHDAKNLFVWFKNRHFKKNSKFDSKRNTVINLYQTLQDLNQFVIFNVRQIRALCAVRGSSLHIQEMGVPNHPHSYPGDYKQSRDLSQGFLPIRRLLATLFSLYDHFLPRYLNALTRRRVPHVVVHILGGRFVPDRLARKYSLDLPSYPGTDTCVKLD